MPFETLIKNSIQTFFQGGTSWVAQLLNNRNVWMVLYCAQQLLGLKNIKTLSPPFFEQSWSITLESHICVKALKCKVFQIIRCLIKPFLKNRIQTIFQGGTSWVAQLLYNMNVWMVLYCAQQLLGLEKTTKPLKVNWNQLKVNWNQLKVNWNQLNSIESKLKSIQSKLKSIENQLKVNWFQLKVTWKSIESKLVSIESNLKSIESNEINWK